MQQIKRMLSDLQRLSGQASIKVNGMDTADMIKTLGNAVLDLDARLKAVETNRKD